MAIDATVGGSAANSYGTIAEANTYFATRFPSSSWAAESGSVVQEQALIVATNIMETYNYVGEKKDITTQALAWPRYSVVDKHGNWLDDDVIPSKVKYAQFEIAYALLENDGLDADDEFSTFSVDGISGTVIGKSDPALPRLAIVHLIEFILPPEVLRV